MNPLNAVDPVARFVAIQDALTRSGDWYGDPTWLRFAAITAVLCPLEPAESAQRIRAAAESLKTGSSWYSDLASPFRFVVAALLVTDGIDPAVFAQELPREHQQFRELGVRHGGQYETLAIAILRHLDRGAPLSRWRTERLKALYDGLKRFHWWLTGPDDLPACACLTALEHAPETIAIAVDQHYKLLQSKGFTGGNHLLIGSALLTLANLPADQAVARFVTLTSAMGRSGGIVWHEDYDAIALLALLDQEADIIVGRHREILTQLDGLTPLSGGQASINLAAALTVLDLLRCDARGIRQHTAADLAGLLDRLHLFTAAALLLSTAADSIAGIVATDWPLGSPIHPLGGGVS